MKQNKKTKQVVIKISDQIREACKGFVFDSITPKTMKLISQQINEIFHRFAPYNDVGNYFNVQCDLKDNNKIIISPKKKCSIMGSGIISQDGATVS